MTILSDDKNEINTNINPEKDKDGMLQDPNGVAQDTTVPQESAEDQERKEFERFKQMQAEQKALGLNPSIDDNKTHITDIFKAKAKDHFNNYEDAEKFLGMLDLTPETWDKDDNLLLTKEAKERYVDRTFSVLNGITERAKEKARMEHEFSEWKLNKDFGSETLASLKLVAKEKFCQSTGLDPEDYDMLPQSHKERIYRKVHQDHLQILKGHTEKVSADIKDPNIARNLQILKDQGLIK